MTGHDLDTNGLKEIVTAFANADYKPEGCASCATGINLHIIVSDDILFHQDDITISQAQGVSEFDAIKSVWFGTQTMRDRADAQAAIEAWRQVAHYALSIHDITGDIGSAGWAELRGNDFVVSMGSWANKVGSVDQQKGSFMHELGHNLKLRHWGADRFTPNVPNENCKSNYLSVMNYAYEFTDWPLPTLTKRAVDYSFYNSSDAEIAVLDETALKEETGFTSPDLTNWPEIRYGTSSGVKKAAADGTLIDWNNNAVTDTIAFNGIEFVNANINNFIGVDKCDSATEGNLDSFDDWNNLVFDFQDSGTFADGLHTAFDAIEEISTADVTAQRNAFTNSVNDEVQSLPPELFVDPFADKQTIAAAFAELTTAIEQYDCANMNAKIAETIQLINDLVTESEARAELLADLENISFAFSIACDSGESIHEPGIPIVLVIDEDSIDTGAPPNFFGPNDINDDIADIGLRDQLPFFATNVGSNITLHTGQVGDEGWFALKTIPNTWDIAGPTTDGLSNYILAGPGLGTPDVNGDREALLDKIPDVIPLRDIGLDLIVGEQICAVVYDSDISIIYDPLEASLKGANLGMVAFKVLSATPLTGFSDLSLPQVDIQILDAEQICNGALETFDFSQIVLPITKEPFFTDSKFSPIGGIDLVFTLDGRSDTNKLTATDPGTYFYNDIITNTGTTDLQIVSTLHIPSSVDPALDEAFCFKASNPIRVYSDLARAVDVTNQASIDPSQPIPKTDTQSLTCQSTSSVFLIIPAGELRYITTHLDFNAKGEIGFDKTASDTYVQGFTFIENVRIDGTRTFTLIPITAVGKDVTAIGGVALDTNLLFKSGLTVQVFDGKDLIAESPVTPPDGFYLVAVPSGGPYKVQLINSEKVVKTTNNISVNQGQFVQVDFLRINPADPAIEGYVFNIMTQGVSDVNIDLYRLTGNNEKLVSSTTTADGGWYIFRFPQPGTYSVQVSTPGLVAESSSESVS